MGTRSTLPGTWTVDAVSTPGTVYGDLVGRNIRREHYDHSAPRSPMAQWEGKSFAV